MNKKGFTLVETLIVSTVVSSILVYFFIQFSTLKRNYNASFKYNTVNDLYALEDIAEYINGVDKSLIQNYFIDTITNKQYVYIHHDTELLDDNVDNYEMILDNDFVDLLDTLYIDTLLVIPENIGDIDKSEFSKGMNKFIDKIKYNGGNNYRLIAQFKDNTYANLIIRLEGLDE